MDWNIKVGLQHGGESWQLNMIASEQSILNMLRMSYTTFEVQVKKMLASSASLPSSAPSGAVDDALVLIRCLIFNKLQEHKGTILQISKARQK
jgi:hypothetical protein